MLSECYIHCIVTYKLEAQVGSNIEERGGLAA